MLLRTVVEEHFFMDELKEDEMKSYMERFEYYLVHLSDEVTWVKIVVTFLVIQAVIWAMWFILHIMGTVLSLIMGI